MSSDSILKQIRFIVTTKIVIDKKMIKRFSMPCFGKIMFSTNNEIKN